MKKKMIITIIGIILIGLCIIGWFVNKQKKEVVEEYVPQEEISEQQLRETMVSLYYQNKETKELIPEGRLIDAKMLLKNPYELLINLLIGNPKNENLETVIPKDTKIHKAEIKGDIVILDFSKEFIDNHEGGEEAEKKTIQSIVNTLTELTEVNGVKILIEGKENQTFLDHKVSFEKVFKKE